MPKLERSAASGNALIGQWTVPLTASLGATHCPRQAGWQIAVFPVERIAEQPGQTKIAL